MSKASEIQALIHLLDDEDELIIENITSKLLSYGDEVIFNLENTWEKTVDPIVIKRIEGLLHEIQFQKVYKKLENWLRDPFPELYKGAEIVAQFHFSDIDSEHIKTLIEGIKQKIWLELNNDLTPLETINTFNHVFYSFLGFKKTDLSKIDIVDFCINEVVETRKGNSISLGILYIILAQDLNIPIYGVNLFKHFILTYQKSFIEDFSIDNSRSSMFYIDAINRGTVFEREEINKYLKNIKHEKTTKSFSAASNTQVINELLFYIYSYYKNTNQNKLAEDINKLRKLF